MSEIAQWLSTLELERYAPAFAEAEIEFTDLAHLTIEDLKELGLPIGPRRRIQQAIVAGSAGANSPAPASAVPPVLGEPTASPAAAVDAERRQLTVMFVDLVGSTELATRLDAEEVRDIITRYQNTVAGVVSRNDGFVARYMGDGVLCYFGWPHANEDDPERAVRAGREIIADVRRSTATDSGTLATRVGIATGVVIVGDLIGTGAAQEAAVVGETPNLAARLQGLAKPDQLIVAEETHALLGNAFEVEPLGEQRLKGIAQPVSVFAVVGERSRESRFDARHTSALTPIVGRSQELALISECWDRARAGSGQMVVVSGEAGIGKSRLLRAVTDTVAADRHLRLTFQCSPYHTESALHPIIARLTYVAGIQTADDNGARLDKLEGLAEINADNVVLMATLLGIDAGERYPPLALSPAQLRTQTIRALVDLLVQQARQRPLLAVFEDLHWVDPTTLEVLDIALDSLGTHRILVLATARPTFVHTFGGHPLVTRISLNRLGAEQTLAIVLKLTDGKPVPDVVVQLIARRTDGVPLFVEELTKTILESGTLEDDGTQLVLDGPLDVHAIPSTLHDSLMARLDRLQPIKEVAQTAACIGREFDHRLLASISPLPEADLVKALDGLIDAELIYRRGLPPEATYVFKHALVRDAAHESLLKDRRGPIHARILKRLEERSDIEFEVLANHAEAAAQTARAIDLWTAASEAAVARPAYEEAIAHLGRAIGLLTPQLASGDRASLERALALQIQLGVASISSRGYQAKTTRAAFRYALVLADRVGETPLRYSVLYGLWVGMYVAAEHAGTLEQAEAMVRVASDSPDSAPLVVAHRTAGVSASQKGQLVHGQEHLDRAYALYDPAVHRGQEARFAQDIGTALHVYLAINLTLLGRTRQAEEHARATERDAAAADHPNTTCYAHTHLALRSLALQDDRETRRHMEVVTRVAGERDLSLWRGYASLFETLVNCAGGEPFDLEGYLAADAYYMAAGARLYLPQIRIATAWQAFRTSEFGPARQLSSMAQELMSTTGETLALSDLHRLDAALALVGGDAEGAETSLHEAIDVGRAQGALLWELRAATDLASLWRERGRVPELNALLTPIIDRVANGDCAPDRARAKALVS